MAGTERGWRIGRRIAPPRFLAFFALLAVGLAAAVPALGAVRGTLAAFDGAAAVFLLSLIGLFRRGDADAMREASRRNDANRVLLLVFTAVVILVVLVMVGAAIEDASDPIAVALVIATLLLAWLFSNVIYALHYAHLFYRTDEDGDAGGLQFRCCDEPDYWDFLYFSATLGMAFATSDTLIASQAIRRVALGQTIAMFIFNLGVIAFAVGALGG